MINLRFEDIELSLLLNFLQHQREDALQSIIAKIENSIFVENKDSYHFESLHKLPFRGL